MPPLNLRDVTVCSVVPAQRQRVLSPRPAPSLPACPQPSKVGARHAHPQRRGLRVAPLPPRGERGALTAAARACAAFGRSGRRNSSSDRTKELLFALQILVRRVRPPASRGGSRGLDFRGTSASARCVDCRVGMLRQAQIIGDQVGMLTQPIAGAWKPTLPMKASAPSAVTSMPPSTASKAHSRPLRTPWTPACMPHQLWRRVSKKR